MSALHFDIPERSAQLAEVREDIRSFVQREYLDKKGEYVGDGFSREFSRKCGEAGFIGMAWSKQFGGSERSFLERYVIFEELLAAGAPIRAHWIADRQSGSVLINYADPEIRDALLPQIVRGELCFCIGLSEANSGSDLFSVRTKAAKVEGGWRITGAKLWTSLAHVADYMIALVRTAPPTKDNRRHGLTQFLVPMNSNGIEVRPIEDLRGAKDFNEVFFDEAFVPDNHVIGTVDEAWKQANAELAFERSGPDRFLETIAVYFELVRLAESSSDPRLIEGLGRLTAQLFTLRQMSMSVAAMLDSGKTPAVEAALVKDLATIWQQALPEVARRIAAGSGDEQFRAVVTKAMLLAPKLTIQGGTTEILRGIVARGLDLR